MNHRVRIGLACLALTIPCWVWAQSAREVYTEANAMEAKADKELNRAYEKAIKKIRAENEKDRAELVVGHLRESQRAWLKFREAQIALVGVNADIGSASSRAAGLAGYNVELTEARIKDLQDIPNPF